MAYKGNLAEVLHSPSEIVTLARAEVEEIRAEGQGLQFGIPALDHVWKMNRRGKLIGVYADTSHGKSAFAKASQRFFLPQLLDGEIGIHWTNEDSVESVGVSDLANISGVPSSKIYDGDLPEVQQRKIKRAEVIRQGQDLWVVGHSNQRKTLNPRMSVYDFLEMMEYIIEVQEKNVRWVWLDYLQLLNLRDAPRGLNTKREKMDDAIAALRDLAHGYSLTVFVNTQVGRHVKGREWKQPQLDDAKETSGFEEACDGALSIWYPQRDMAINTPIDAGTEMLKVTKELVLLQVLKQKNGETGNYVALDFVPEYGAYVPYSEAAKYRADPEAYSKRQLEAYA